MNQPAVERRTLDDFPEVLTIEEAGQVLGLSRWSAYQAAKAGRIPTVKLGVRRTRVPKEMLRRFLATGELPEQEDAA
jgi:excisionase family DNA binding protein